MAASPASCAAWICASNSAICVCNESTRAGSTGSVLEDAESVSARAAVRSASTEDFSDSSESTKTSASALINSIRAVLSAIRASMAASSVEMSAARDAAWASRPDVSTDSEEPDSPPAAARLNSCSTIRSSRAAISPSMFESISSRSARVSSSIRAVSLAIESCSDSRFQI